MKPVPPDVVASGPPGTQWFGGRVDRSTASLRVMARARGGRVDKEELSRLLGHESDREKFRHWCLHAPASGDGDVDGQILWILQRLTPDVSIWKKIAAEYRVDVFCGLFLERSNREITVSAATMAELGDRGIELGFDIYAPDTPEKNHVPDPTLPVMAPAGQEPRRP